MAIRVLSRDRFLIKMKAPKLLILAILTLGGMGFFSVAYAAGLSISPVTFELTSNPGDVLTNKLRIYNQSESTIAVKMEVEDFTATGETGEVRVMPAEAETYSLARWVSVTPETFTLGPNEQKFIDFIINVPQNAEPGGKYGSVLASTAGIISPEKEIVGAAISQKVGALVLLTVSGDVVEELEVEEFLAPSFLEYGPVSFAIRFKNTGTVHVRPRGYVTITNWRGKKAVDIEFPQQNVIPNAIRRIETSWNKKWLFGRYSATLVGIYGTGNLPIKPPVVFFWVFPWKLALGISLVLTLLIAYFVKTRKRWWLALKILVRGERR